MTRVALMQPYLFPAPAYLQLAAAVDTFVFYDDAQFSHGRWTHRNRIAVGGRPHLFTAPLAARGPDKPLNEIALDPRNYPHWSRKFLRTLQQAYATAPFVEIVVAELEALLAREHRSIAELAADSVHWLAERFGIETRWLRSSDLAYDREASAQNKVMEIVESVGGTHYVNMPGGRDLYSASDFNARDLRVGFVEDESEVDEFGNLSALHAAMHLGPDRLEEIAKRHRIDWMMP